MKQNHYSDEIEIEKKKENTIRQKSSVTVSGKSE
jgi:hypothetical protein